MSVIQSRRREPYVALVCNACKAEIEYLTPIASSSSTSKVQCCVCHALLDLSGSASANRSSTKPQHKARRRIGTDAAPLDTTYYELLGVSVQATDQEIKSAYRRLAIKLHPDKNRNDPEAAESFKQLALAYTTLSDPASRHKYNEFGTQAQQQEDGFIDPEAVFSTLFGGERFVDIIGTISLGQEMKNALQQTEEEEEEEEEAQGDGAPHKKKREMTLEERRAKLGLDRQNAERRAKARAQRVDVLEKKLLHKLAIFTEQDPHPDVDHSVRTIWKIEAEELKSESYGVELLHAVGHVYMAKARQFAASSNTPLGIGGWFHGVKTTAHVFSETYSTLRSAYELSDVFKEISAAEEKGLTAEQKKALEDKAAQKAMLALFKGAKLEVDSVIREVCDRILEAKLPIHVLARRATGLELLGEAYTSVRKDEQDDSDYVRIDRAVPPRPVPPNRPVPPRPTTAPRPTDAVPPIRDETRPAHKEYVPRRPL